MDQGPNVSISQKGEYQAFLTGKSIVQDYIDKTDPKSLKKIVMLASPYKRCIQTAVNICKGMEELSGEIFEKTIYVCFQA